MTIAAKLLQMNGVKEDIRDAIESFGFDLSESTFFDYAQWICDIGTATQITITADPTAVGTIADDLTQLSNIKTDIKNAIESKGIDLTGVPFSEYADYIYQIEPEPQYELTFTALESGSSIDWTGTYPDMEFSKNGGSWFTFSTYHSQLSNLGAGDIVRFRSSNWTASSDSSHFTTTGSFDLSGNIMSLTGSLLSKTLTINDCFNSLFKDCDIVSAQHLNLPATTITAGCYQSMFKGCTMLEVAPEILPATSLYGKTGCYNSMFYGCTSLEEAPKLPATTLYIGCYNYMFKGCSNLNFIKALSLTELDSNYSNDWVDGVAATGTFIKNSNATWTSTGIDSVPTGWAVIDDSYVKITAGTDPAWGTVSGSGYYAPNSTVTLTATGQEGYGFVEWQVDGEIVSTSNPYTFTATEDLNVWAAFEVELWPYLTITAKQGNSTVQIANPYNTTDDIEYSTDGINWYQFTTGNTVYDKNGLALESTWTGTEQIVLDDEGDFVQLRVANSQGNRPFCQHSNNPTTVILCFGDVGITGRLVSLQKSNPTTNTLTGSVSFAGLFRSVTLSGYDLSQDISTVDIELPKIVNASDVEVRSNTSANYSYMFYGMFQNCTSLTSAELNIEIEDNNPQRYNFNYAFEYMFSGCTSLVTPPSKLPRMQCYQTNEGYKSGEYGYGYMFQNCTSLTRTPLIYGIQNGRQTNATTTSYAAYWMFNGCSSLTDLYVDGTWVYSTTSRNGGTTVFSCYNWMNGVSQNGTIHLPDTSGYTGFDTFLNNRGVHGAPANWTIVKGTPLKFTANTAGSTVSLGTYGNPSPIQLETSTDGTTWTSYTINDTITLTNVGDYVMFRGDNNSFNAYSNCYEFAMNGSIAASGKVTSLYDSTCQSDTIPADYMFGYLFYNCTALTHAPELPATNLRENCYTNMFYGCTALTAAPELPATTVADYCYSNMFRGCSSLVQAPDLPATGLADRCYSNMFRGCSSLVQAPDLPATILVDYCYNSMFYGCTSLNYIKCLATDIYAPNCTTSWVSNVSETGTFVKDASMTSWTTGNNGIPSGWTVIDAS